MFTGGISILKRSNSFVFYFAEQSFAGLYCLKALVSIFSISNMLRDISVFLDRDY